MTTPLQLLVHPTELNPVDDRLFGQFLEIASFGDQGPEALVDPATGQLPEPIVEKLQWLSAPVIRFPAGSDADYLDWTDRIDLPGRSTRPESTGKNNKPVTNHFGYDEALALCDELQADPLFVVNFGRVLWGDWSIERGAAHAAAMVSYMNGTPGKHVDADGTDWAAIRQSNGRAEPWQVKYWQVGNETWLFDSAQTAALAKAAGVSLERWITDALIAYGRSMREVDPDIVLICDFRITKAAKMEPILSDPTVRELYDIVTMHEYKPGGRVQFLRDEQPIAADALSDAEKWYAFASMPASYDEKHQAVAVQPHLEPWYAGYDIAVTEWNWNGFGQAIGDNADLAWTASGLGAAGYLHGLMRDGQRVKLATQSMMLGVGWRFAAVQASRENAFPPFIVPSGLATGLYSRHHGDRRLAFEMLDPIPTVEQHLSIKGWGTHVMQSPLPLLDVVVTRDDVHLYLHVINRRFDQTQALRFDFSAFHVVRSAMHHMILPQTDAGRVAEHDLATVKTAKLNLRGNALAVTLPARSVSVIEVPLRGDD